MNGKVNAISHPPAANCIFGVFQLSDIGIGYRWLGMSAQFTARRWQIAPSVFPDIRYRSPATEERIVRNIRMTCPLNFCQRRPQGRLKEEWAWGRAPPTHSSGVGGGSPRESNAMSLKSFWCPDNWPKNGVYRAPIRENNLSDFLFFS